MVPLLEALPLALVAALAAGLAWESHVRRREQRGLTRSFEEAWRAQGEELAALREANRELAARLDALRREEAGGGAMLAEMRVLQRQLERLGAPAPKPAGGDEAAASPRRRTPAGAAPRDMLEITREALSRNRVDLYLQPVVTLPQRHVRYYEGFSRIRDEQGRVLTPAAYMETARARELMPAIDNLLLFRCVQLVRRIKRKNLKREFFVNVYADTLKDDDFFAQFVDFMEANPELGDSLIFEIAQADMTRCGEAVATLSRRLSPLGFRLSMDRVERLDFDFEALARQGVRFVKVPADLLLSARDAQIHPTDFAEALRRRKIELIVDHIEDERTLLELLDLDVELGQGYLFGRPRASRDEPEATRPTAS
jgi:cyclic-di-GMP phosphodiesterase, flagellum assembly factor TipF